MKPDQRVFEIRFYGLYEPPTVVALTDGELKHPKERLKVVPASELERIKGLLDECKTAMEFAAAPDMWISNGEFNERFEYKYNDWYQDKLNAVLEKIRGK